MSDPAESAEVNPHPAASHREPRQIAADEHGPAHPQPAQTRPVSDVNPDERIDAENKADAERRRTVKHSAHTQAIDAEREAQQAGHSPPEKGRSRQ